MAEPLGQFFWGYVYEETDFFSFREELWTGMFSVPFMWVAKAALLYVSTNTPN